MLAIDPGSRESAWVLLDQDGRPFPNDHGKIPNADLLSMLRGSPDGESIVVIEQIRSYDMRVGAEVFDTCHWSGRFYEACGWARAIVQMPRLEVKMALIPEMGGRAKDANIIAAVKDRFGGTAARGTKAAPGPLYGIRADEWQALALGLAYLARPVDELEEAF